MTTALYVLLAVALALPAGWIWGHRTARIRHVPIGALPEDDEAAFLDDERHRFDQLVAGIDLDPDDRQGHE